MSQGGFAYGALVGTFAVGALLLAGLAVLGRSVSAACAMMMVLTAVAAMMVGNGVFGPSLTGGPAPIAGLLEAAFAASAIIFLSSTLESARNNAILGGIHFAAALSAVAIGLANLAMGGAFAGAVRVIAIGGLAIAALSVLNGALRGERGARLVLPGVLLAAAAPAMGALASSGSGAGFGASFAPGLGQMVFAAGVISAGFIGALDTTFRRAFDVSPFGRSSAPGDFAVPVGAAPVGAAPVQQAMSAGTGPDFAAKNGPEVWAVGLKGNQLAQVLDYSGVAVWDWNAGSAEQTASFCEMMDAEESGVFTPDAMRAFIHEDAREIFERKVFGGADGGFDELIKLTGGRTVRMRGARAVDGNGAIERIVVFVEEPAAKPQSEGLLKNAAAALAGAAAAGGARRPQEAAFVSAVADAIDADAIGARFQPIIRLSDRKTVGYETLMYWPEGPDTDTGEALSADTIILAAREAGRGPELTRCMVRHAAQKIAGLRAAPAGGAASTQAPFVAFNVSASEILAPGFADDVIAISREFALKDGSLVLEVTETEKLNGADYTAVFDKLKRNGVVLAFDDFGAGFSCLANLHRFSFDFMKIDKSFIERMVDDPGAAKIVAALAGLAGDLGMKVIAEGVESNADALAAKAAGCAYAQGFFFGAPALDAPAERDGASMDAPEARDPADHQPAEEPAIASDADADQMTLRASDRDDTPYAKPAALLLDKGMRSTDDQPLKGLSEKLSAVPSAGTAASASAGETAVFAPAVEPPPATRGGATSRLVRRRLR